MVLRMARPWKHPNSGVFYLRVRVPIDLVSLVGRTLAKQSLRTKDVGEARAFRRPWRTSAIDGRTYVKDLFVRPLSR